MPWWSWAMLGYIAIGVRMIEYAYRADRECYGELEHRLWVVCVLGAVALWPLVWWMGLDKKS